MNLNKQKFGSAKLKKNFIAFYIYLESTNVVINDLVRRVTCIGKGKFTNQFRFDRYTI